MAEQLKKGFFITFEGGEGAGKSTQAEKLVDRLRLQGYRARFTQEPGGTPIARALRVLLLYPSDSIHALAEAKLTTDEDAEPLLPITEVLLFSAARAQHVQRIREWLEAGEVVVCDRYVDATRVYQGVARGLESEIIDTAQALATGGLMPNLTLLFDLPVAVGQRRKRRNLRTDVRQPSLFDANDWNRIDNETLEFHERVRRAYLSLVKEDDTRWVVLKANVPQDKLAEEILRVVNARLEDFKRTSWN
jgi:dTMP kinase